MSRISDLIKSEAEAAEAAESIYDDRANLPENTTVVRGHGRSKTLQIRLNGDEYEMLEHLAKARELPISTVARGLLLSSLAPTNSPGEAVQQLEAALAEVRRHLEQP